MTNEATGEGSFPFAIQPGEEIGRGVEFRVLRHVDGWVVKEGIHPEANTFEQLKQDKEDYEVFQKYLAKFLPETQHIRGNNSEGNPVNIIRQREIRGAPLSDLSNAAVFDNKEVRFQLVELMEGCTKMWDEIGRAPDLYGPQDDKIKVFNPRFARNIMLEEGTSKIWLVDTAASSQVFSKKTMLQYRPSLFVLRASMKRFLNKLRKTKS